jgi:hypothetical protein
LTRRELEDGDGGEHLAGGGQLRGDTLHTPLRRQASGPTIEKERHRDTERSKAVFEMFDIKYIYIISINNESFPSLCGKKKRRISRKKNHVHVPFN